MSHRRETWSGRLGFILATVGSAVGLGSIWKFPYEVGSNGGSAFLLFYLLGLVLIVTPLMFAEFALGRRGAGDAVTGIGSVAASFGASKWWKSVGLLGVITGILVLSFYSVIGGWTIAYAFDTAIDGLSGTDIASAQSRYQAMLASPVRLALFHALFMAAAALVVSRGVGRGIEAASTILMPVLAVLMVILAGYSLAQGDVAATLRFMFTLDTRYLNAQTALDALGLGFFSIGVGFGLMITYAAYSGAELNLRQVAIASIVADTAISFFAGLAVFPIVFAHGLNPAGGPGLVFVTLPLAFAQMPLGALAAVAFYVLLLVAALASAISFLELAVAPVVNRWGWSRPRATASVALLCFVLGLATVLSFNLWSNWYPLNAVNIFKTSTVFDLLDYLTSNLMLPICGFFLSILAGWALPVQLLAEELRLSMRGANILQSTLRYVIPVVIAVATLAPMMR